MTLHNIHSHTLHLGTITKITTTLRHHHSWVCIVSWLPCKRLQREAGLSGVVSPISHRFIDIMSIAIQPSRPTIQPANHLSICPSIRAGDLPLLSHRLFTLAFHHRRYNHQRLVQLIWDTCIASILDSSARCNPTARGLCRLSPKTPQPPHGAGSEHNCTYLPVV